MGENNKTCMFYANEYHFELIALSYINGELKKDRDVVVLTEKNIETTAARIIDKMEISKEEKVKIAKIDLNNEYKKKIEEIKKNLDNSIKTTVVIKGREEYIKNIHQEIQVDDKNLKIVDSYDIEEVGSSSADIVKKYDIVINMLGEKQIV